MKITEPKTCGGRTSALLAEADDPFNAVTKSWSNCCLLYLKTSCQLRLKSQKKWLENSRIFIHAGYFLPFLIKAYEREDFREALTSLQATRKDKALLRKSPSDCSL